MLAGLKGGYPKFCCFICAWDSRKKVDHYETNDWPMRSKFRFGEKSIEREALIPLDKVLLSPLHIKLGLFSSFIKSLKANSHALSYLREKFPGVSEAKVKAGVFVGPQIRKLMNDDVDFVKCLSTEERNAWRAFMGVCNYFLGNYRSPLYKEIVQHLLTCYKAIGVKMSLKLHFLHYHLDRFPASLGAVSDEQGERFHQDIAQMEKHYNGAWTASMLGDYCWMLYREDAREPSRKQKRVHFPIVKDKSCKSVKRRRVEVDGDQAESEDLSKEKNEEEAEVEEERFGEANE
jgi:hypothetical protein